MTDVNVDSANTTAILYDSYGSTPWLLTRITNNGEVFAQTLTRATSAGGALFRFRGTDVKVYGTLTLASPPGAKVGSTYTIDGGDPTPFSSASIPASLIQEVDNQLFFDSGTLSDGNHTLVINITDATTSTPYLLDYIRYTSTGPQPPPAGAPVNTTSAAPSASQSSSSKSRVGPIVGGVIGGVAFVVLVALFIFFRFFRHRIDLNHRRRGHKEDLASELTDVEPKSETTISSTPFLSEQYVTMPFAPPSTVGPDDSASQVAGRRYLQESGPLGGSAAEGSGSGASDRGGPSSRNDRKLPIPPPVEAEGAAVQHQDSGIRFRDNDNVPVLPQEVVPMRLGEMPPEYSS